MASLNKYVKVVFLSSLIIVVCAGLVQAQELYINILAVNGSDTQREKEIMKHLPHELEKEDILDTGGLELEYDVNTGAYFVKGNIILEPKETKTYRVRIKDVWVLDEGKVDEIRQQMDENFERIRGTEYEDSGQVKYNMLNERLDFVVAEQQKYAENIEKRIDQFRIYADEFDEIRENSLSVKYWRSKPPSADEVNVVNFIIEVENPSSTSEKTLNPKHYLPKEVMPEHLTNLQDFEVGYDPIKRQTFLTKKEILEPGEVKKYSIGILDVWKVVDNDINELRERADKAYTQLKFTDYQDNAKYLYTQINKKLDEILDSQAQTRPIDDHISAYRLNKERYEQAKNDVQTLEELLDSVRENVKQQN